MGAALLVAGIAASIALFSSPGTYDVTDERRGFLTWMADAVELGPIEGYRANPYDYPPGSKLLLGAAGSVGDAAGLDRPTSYKLLLLFFQAATALVAFTLTGSLPLAGALWAATSVSAMAHGYLDILFAPFLVVSLVGLARRQPAVAWVFLWLACFIKQQPLLLVPFYVVHLGRIDGFASLRRLVRNPTAWGTAAWTAAALLAVTLAFGRTATGEFATVQALERAAAHRDVSGNALNLGWVGSYAYQVAKYGELGAARVRETHWRNVIKAGAGCVLLWVLWLQIRAPKTPLTALFAMLTGYLAYFTFNAGVHENHLFVPMILAIVLGAFLWHTPGAHRDVPVMPLLFSTVIFANVNLLLFFDSQGAERAPLLLGPRQLDITAPVAGVSLVLFVAAVTTLRAIGQRTRERAVSRAAANSGRARSTMSSLAVSERRK